MSPIRSSACVPLLLAAALTSGLPLVARACPCSGVPDFRTTFNQSAAIFVGDVVEVTPAGPEFQQAVWVTFKVRAYWKGDLLASAQVLTGASAASCGVAFEPGARYLVYARTGRAVYGPMLPGELWTHACWRTHRLTLNDPDLDLLGPSAVVIGTWGGLKSLYR